MSKQSSAVSPRIELKDQAKNVLEIPDPPKKEELTITGLRKSQVKYRSKTAGGLTDMEGQAAQALREAKKFSVQNGYLLRMIEDGCNVILSDDMKNKLFFHANESVMPTEGEDGETI